MTPAPRSGPPRLQLVAAYAALYLVWGSTYLFIRFAIEAIPPLVMAGSRFLIAGVLLFAAQIVRGTPPPRGREWLWALALGGLFFVGGNGSVVWSEQKVPSGVVALAVATVPLWVMLLPWLFRRASAPTPLAWAGLALGCTGMAVLVGPALRTTGTATDPVGIVVLALGPVGWATGTLLARRAAQPASPFAAGALQMIGGGTLLLLLGGALGEWPRVDLAAITPRAWGSFLALVFAGSIVAFSAYVWLLRHQPPAAVATYAYVNPLVAVLLGWAFAREPITPGVLLAGALIVTAVAMITRATARRARA